MCLHIAVLHVIDDPVVHKPGIAEPVGIGCIFYIFKLAFLEHLHGDMFHALRFGIITASIDDSLYKGTVDFLYDNMFLTCRCSVALYFILQRIVIGIIGSGNYFFIKPDSKQTDNKAKYNCRGGNAIKAYTAGFHSGNFAGTGHPAVGHKGGQQHGHRECPDTYVWQTVNKNFHNHGEGSPVVGDVLRYAEKCSRSDKYG